MSSTSPGDPGPPTDTESPYDGGPRVSWDDVKDLGRIRRSTTNNKKIAGVAGGIARHLDIDPVVVRIAFVVLALFGGGGILLYGACWLFVPDERTHQAVINVDHRSRTVILAIVGVLAGLSAIGDSLGGFGFPWPMVVIAIGIVVMLSMKNRYHGPPDEEPAAQPGADEPGAASYAGYQPPTPMPDPRRRGPVLFWFTMALSLVAIGVLLTLELAGVDLHPAAYPAAVVGACGLMLLVGAFYGRAGGLIPMGLLASLITLLMSVATPASGDLLSVGQTKVSPTTLSDLDESYAVGVGELKIDLTETDLTDAENQTLDLDVGMGHIQVLVPEEGLAVTVDAAIGIGEIKVFDDKYSSSIDDYHRGGDAGDPLLTITADGRIGQIEILTPEDLRR